MATGGARLEGEITALGTLHAKEREVAPPLATLGLHVEVVAIDTNAFGTFDGRVPRAGSAGSTVVAKATASADAAGRRYGVASEGSFATRLDWPLCPTDLELVALVDRESGLVVIGRAQTPAPWARPGVDLRAHRCPPRRPNIAAAAEDLAQRLARRCPSCDAPGVGPVRYEAGRPCAWCGGPTLEVVRTVVACPACALEVDEPIDGPADPGSCPACNP